MTKLRVENLFEKGELRMSPAKQDRTEFGHVFQWHEATECWVSTSGQKTLIFPPTEHEKTWLMVIPGLNHIDKFVGKDAETRIFAVAELYTRPAKLSV